MKDQDGHSKNRNSRILLVDDDRDFRDSVEIVLKSNNYDVLTASGLNPATDVLKTEKVDLIVTDLKMNDGSGMELLAVSKELNREIGVIILTAYGSIKNAVEAMKQGAYDYVAKPFDNEELLVIIEKALEHKDICEELSTLREEIAWKYGFDSFVGISDAVKQLKSLAARVALTDIAVLITGESGTGKELLARAIHYHSSRRKHKFVPIECTSVPENLLESEFFGHMKGSFTSAYDSRKGLFEEADGGTVLLDEVGDMPLSIQAKILRVLQESEIRPVGSSISRKIDVRIIAATNKDLTTLVKTGMFREDLFYRLNVLPVHIPPLRERIDDIPILVERFIRTENTKTPESRVSITAEAMEKLISHKWPGNVRELENTIKRAVALSRDGRIRADDILFISSEELPSPKMISVNGKGSDLGTLEDSLRKRITATLYANDWNVTKTAVKLGIGRTTLWRKIRKYNIRKDSEPVERHY
jgi:DNA-binding NtrC family response regulator